MFNGLIIFVFVTGYLVITLEHKTGVNKAATALFGRCRMLDIEFYARVPLRRGRYAPHE